MKTAIKHSVHGEHGEKTMACIFLTKEDEQETALLKFFAVPAVSPWLKRRYSA